ncbi:aurora kinase A-like [Boleophthalmus pectinirostris]|uniref:aurora kinase A-like n=1 Tax=Boleophthalmus pectinirostris TaxID=150288 RepID=UPI00242AA922|nr:aurora kinase A-like [Boleophthalmus pectinirostris]
MTGQGQGEALKDGCPAEDPRDEEMREEIPDQTDKPESGNDESSSSPGSSRVLSQTGSSTSPNDGHVQNTKRMSPCKEEEECYGSRLSSSNVVESDSEAFKRLIEVQNKQERPKEYKTLSDAQERHTQEFPSAPSCSSTAFSSTPGTSGVLSCPGTSGTKRRSSCSEQEDEEQSSSPKKTKADDAPKKRKFKLKHDLALWKKVWLKKTARSRVSSSDVERSCSEGGQENKCDSDSSLSIKEQMEQETQADSTPSGADRVALKFISKNKVKYTDVVIFRQLVDQANELESKGIFHLDIKPDNVLLETGFNLPRASFVDFISAVLFTPGQEFNNPQGTPIYFSPEWFREHSYTAGPTMVWQLGMESIGSMRSVPIPQCIPRGCRDLLSGCLKKDPEERLTLQSIKDHPWLKSA